MDSKTDREGCKTLGLLDSHLKVKEMEGGMTNHSLYFPHGIWIFWCGRDAVVNGIPSSPGDIDRRKSTLLGYL